MSKKSRIVPYTGSIYTGSSTNQPITISTTGTTSGATLSMSGGSIVYNPAPVHNPAYFDLYEEDGNLFWKNSKGEVFKLTFTKQEIVKEIIKDL